MTGLVGLAGAGVALVQLRRGIVPLLDTVTYWSGAESVATGNPFRTTLAPSFSNFDAVTFLERSGSIPFVDFPVAYPLVSGIVGMAIGTRAAMHVLCVIAIAAIAVSIVLGGDSSRQPSTESTDPTVATSSMYRRSAALGLLALLVPLVPAVRLVTQGTLSEPLFIATTMFFVVSLARYRNGGRWGPVATLVVIGSLLRFLGAPLALLAAWERYRRTKDLRRSATWALGLLAPAAVNIAAASAAGGGHDAGWRGLDRMDIEVFVRSVGGWFDASQGDLRRTYFTADGPSWWSWPTTAAVLIVMAVASAGVLRKKRVFTDSADIALTCAAMLSLGLIAGILGFDALVIADNRLMLPAGILVISAMVWTAVDRCNSSAASHLVIIMAILAWGAAAVRPWNATELFSDIVRPLAMSQVAEDLDVDIVISNDADGVHWDTGIPAVYTPMSVKPLTGERVDDVRIYRRLPCALLEANGAVVISNEATFSTVNRDELDRSAAQGTLRRINRQDATVYLPTSNACDE